MANLAKREFDILELSGEKFFEWRVDVTTHLLAKGIEKTIEKVEKKDKDKNEVVEVEKCTPKEKAQAIAFLRHHIHECLKTEYMFVNDPQELWEKLNERFEHQNRIFLPDAQHEWSNLRVQDYKSITEYNSALLRITSQLISCGEVITEKQKLEKTFSIMHANDVTLQQQYRQMGFEKFSEFITILLIAEKNNNLLMKNHNMRPSGSKAFPEANIVDKGFPGGNPREYKSRWNRGRGELFKSRWNPREF